MSLSTLHQQNTPDNNKSSQNLLRIRFCPFLDTLREIPILYDVIMGSRGRKEMPKGHVLLDTSKADEHLSIVFPSCNSIKLELQCRRDNGIYTYKCISLAIGTLSGYREELYSDLTLELYSGLYNMRDCLATLTLRVPSFSNMMIGNGVIHSSFDYEDILPCEDTKLDKNNAWVEEILLDYESSFEEDCFEKLRALNERGIPHLSSLILTEFGLDINEALELKSRLDAGLKEFGNKDRE